MPRVTVLPASQTFEARPGEQLLSAAWRAGIGIKSVCGGRGRCGSCRIDLRSGDALGTAVNPPTEAEREWLPGHSIGEQRLACQCEVRDDVLISIPPESQAVRSPPRKPYTLIEMAVLPVVARVPLKVEDAYALPPRSLATRIAQAAATATGRHAVELPPDVIADFSLNPDFDAARDVVATLHHGRRVIQLLPGKRAGLYGVAIDIGTTAIVVFLCDLASGEMLASCTAANPQGIHGEDVISRISQIQQNPAALGEMQDLVVAELNRLIDQACAEASVANDDIVDAVAVGNPTMQHILLGINPLPLARGPYLPVWSEGTAPEAKSLGLQIAPRARVLVFPMVAGFIGGDTLAAVLTRGPEFYRGTQLLIDIGTNGEVVLSHEGQLTATSCATGPVYEGAHIRCGMRAMPGAIERIWIGPDDGIRWSTIGETRAGACPGPAGPVRLRRHFRHRRFARRGADRGQRRNGPNPDARRQSRRGEGTGAGTGPAIANRAGHRADAAGRACRATRQIRSSHRHRDAAGGARRQPHRQHLSCRHLRQSPASRWTSSRSGWSRRFRSSGSARSAMPQETVPAWR